VIYPWRHWYFGGWHFAECTTCGETMARWDGDQPTRPARKKIDAHLSSH
jgi:hypothetical protein